MKADTKLMLMELPIIVLLLMVCFEKLGKVSSVPDWNLNLSSNKVNVSPKTSIDKRPGKITWWQKLKWKAKITRITSYQSISVWVGL